MTVTQQDEPTAPARGPVDTGATVTQIGAAPCRRGDRSLPARVPEPLPCSGPRSAPVGPRLTTRGRVVLALAWAGIAVLAAWATVALVGVFGAGGVTSEPYSGPTTTVSVDRGDTLWAVVAELDTTADPQQVVAQIVELNGLDSSADLRPGDILEVPSTG